MKLFQPTLTRRVILAVLFAMALIWVFLMGFEFLRLRWIESHDNPNMTEFNLGVIDALQDAQDTRSAAQIAAWIDRRILNGRQRAGVDSKFEFQVFDNQNQLIYHSPGIDASYLKPNTGVQQTQIINGRIYQVATLVTPQWTVVSGQERVDTSWALKRVSREITLEVLMSIPIAMLPVWLAVSTGLRPLRRISERIAARSINDLSPIGITAKYTEIKPIITALDELLIKLNATIYRERAFVHDAAHELRTPMAVISAQAHALVKAPATADRHDAEQALNAALKRASHLVHQLLMLARLDTQVVTETIDIDLAQLLRQDLTGFAAAAATRDIELVLEAPDKLMCAIAVPTFQSIVSNLVDNAIRYGHQGGSVIVDLQHHDKGFSVSVTDDGPGIPLGDQQRVFERFFRGSGHDVSGTGLGLAIASQAALLLGGSIELTPGRDGHGCRFTFTSAIHNQCLVNA